MKWFLRVFKYFLFKFYTFFLSFREIISQSITLRFFLVRCFWFNGFYCAIFRFPPTTQSRFSSYHVRQTSNQVKSTEHGEYVTPFFLTPLEIERIFKILWVFSLESMDQHTFGVINATRKGIMNPVVDVMVRAIPANIPTKCGAMSKNDSCSPPIKATEIKSIVIISGRIKMSRFIHLRSKNAQW